MEGLQVCLCSTRSDGFYVTPQVRNCFLNHSPLLVTQQVQATHGNLWLIRKCKPTAEVSPKQLQLPPYRPPGIITAPIIMWWGLCWHLSTTRFHIQPFHGWCTRKKRVSPLISELSKTVNSECFLRILVLAPRWWWQSRSSFLDQIAARRVSLSPWPSPGLNTCVTAA